MGTGTSLAAEIRLNLYDYTIAVNGVPWNQVFGCVWEPVFNPANGKVVAPVKAQGKWTLAEDGRLIWERGFVQLWQARYSPDGKRLAAIVAPEFGRWTVAVDGTPWRATVREMVTDAVFSPDGARIAAVVKDQGRWSLAADGRIWQNAFDMAWRPVFSPDGLHLAAKVQRNGRYTIVVDDRPWRQECEMAWDPVFSPDGDKLLLRSIEGGTYFRRVVPVAGITG